MRGLKNLQAIGLAKNQLRLCFFNLTKKILLHCNKIFCKRVSLKSPGRRIILFIITPVRCCHDALALRQTID